jgi:small subunit ribosomal protein S17
MPKRVAIGVVTSDKAAKTRRVEIPRQVRHPKYGKILHRKTICHVHDEKSESKAGDTVEIVECPPKSATKRWELVRVVERSKAVDLAAMRAAAKALEEDAGLG